MESLWAPWRMEYIEHPKSDECIFCTLPKADADARNLILFRGPLCFVIVNAFPYNTGHLMVSPYRHLNCLTKLGDAEMAEMGRLTQICIDCLRAVYAPNGFNVGVNLGKTAGAGFDEHVHTHIVPRWSGDTNFMPVLADVKVHPQHLLTVYGKLLPLFRKSAI